MCVSLHEFSYLEWGLFFFIFFFNWVECSYDLACEGVKKHLIKQTDTGTCIEQDGIRLWYNVMSMWECVECDRGWTLLPKPAKTRLLVGLVSKRWVTRRRLWVFK
ncbi:hypothetical protein B0T10DRAFT_90423 [Thelonectria olida]|uniref:Uncharacterized protein n=1 Tax=Thelonectria olida TaxID=1576542 RepID=A0A9P8W2Q9_9HYPO|nr:hypothetical protein B0T10DRAFT_90423 [Thelonectria olida]